MRFQVLSFSVLSSFLDTIVNEKRSARGSSSHIQQPSAPPPVREKRQCFKLFFEKFQPVYQFPYIMCYNSL